MSENKRTVTVQLTEWVDHQTQLNAENLGKSNEALKVHNKELNLVGQAVLEVDNKVASTNTEVTKVKENINTVSSQLENVKTSKSDKGHRHNASDIDGLSSSGGSLGLTIFDFYKKTKNNKKIVMLGDSTVISGGKISERLAEYQKTGHCLEGSNIINKGAIGKTLDGFVKSELQGAINDKADLYIFCLGINDLMNLNQNETQIANNFKLAIDGLLSNAESCILLRLPCIRKDKPEWKQILRNIYMSYRGYSERLDVIDIPLLTSTETITDVFLVDSVHPSTEGYYAIADELVNRICNIDLDFRGVKREENFKGYVVQKIENKVKIISQNNNFISNSKSILYIGNMPMAYKKIKKTDNNIYELELDVSYSYKLGIVRLISDVNLSLFTSYDYNANDWYKLEQNKIWYVFDITNLNLGTSTPTITASYSCIAKSELTSTRITGIFNTKISTNDAIWTNSPTKACEINKFEYIEDIKMSCNARNPLNGNETYLIFCIDILGNIGELDISIGNLNVAIGSTILNDKFIQFYNCGTPKITGSPILMTQESVLRLLMNLKLIDENYLPIKPIPPTNKPVQSIALNKPTTTINKGNSETLTYTITPSDATNRSVTWSTSSQSIATVENGIVRAISDGQCDIIVTTVDGNKTDKCRVTVQTPSVNKPVESITLNKLNHTFKVDETVQLNVNFTPSDATNKNITWSCNNANATVVNGLVTAKTEGSAIITATSQDGNKTATCNLTIQAKDNSGGATGKVTDGLILELDATDYSGNTSNWTDNTGNYGDFLLNNLTFDGDTNGWTGKTLKLGKAIDMPKTITKKDIDIANLNNLEGFTFEINYKCQNDRIVSNYQTPLITFPTDTKITEKSNTIDKLYFESYLIMKVGDVLTNDSTGGNKNIIITTNKSTGNVKVYLNAVKVLDLTGSIGDVYLNKKLFEIKQAKGFNFEIGSIRMYNKTLNEQEITRNNTYEKSLNR